MNGRYQYRPLPNGLYIADSPIHGQGLFTDIHMLAGTIIGVARHETVDAYGQPYATYRTPLGGFVNQTPDGVEPNCVMSPPDMDGLVTLVTAVGVFPGDELTVEYRLGEYQ